MLFFIINNKRKTKLISLSPNPCYGNNFKTVSRSFKGEDASEIILNGDNALNENRLQDALSAYKKALDMDSSNTNINRKLGRTYHKLKDYKSAEENFQIYTQANNQDCEAWIELGEAQRQQGRYTDAKKSFETAVELDKNNDLAKRSLLETENNILSCTAPQKAYEESYNYAQENLQKALSMAVKYLTPEFMRDLADIQIKFGKTASMSGTNNIAQYENGIKAITVSDKYKYASPVVIAAYLVHESIHAKDKDPYTSVREEQDAYQIATKFWIKNSKGIKDPEMDYAAGLYKQSPSALSKRVEEIYVLRDPDIAKTSPNHPPDKKHFNLKKSKAANQPIKTYDAIA